MKELIITHEGKEFLQKVLNIWPPIIHQQRKERIVRILGWIVGARGLAEAGKDEVLEAVKEVVPKSYDPIFDIWKDPERWKKEFLGAFEDMELYKKLPIQAKRWESPPVEKPSKPPEEMKVIAFCASPRKNGNTDLLVQEALTGATDAGAQGEKIMLQKANIGFCIGCRKCKDEGYNDMCVVKDDMDEIYHKIEEADAIIIGFPIYTGRECAQLSTFLDRWDAFERFRLISSLKPGRRSMVIGTWGYTELNTYDHVIENVISCLGLHHVQTVEALSACSFEGKLHGLDEKRKGVIAKHPELLKKAFDAGVSLVGGN